MKSKYLKELIQLILTIKNEKELENFLLGIFTPKELSEIPTRLQIVKMLKNGIPQQKIANQLGTGIATVTRGSREIKMNRFKYI